MNHSPIPKCPECQRTLQNRLVDQCLYCGADIPDHLILTDQEKAVIIQQQLEQIEQDCKLRDQKEAEEKEKQERLRRNSNDGWGINPFIF